MALPRPYIPSNFHRIDGPKRVQEPSCKSHSAYFTHRPRFYYEASEKTTSVAFDDTPPLSVGTSSVSPFDRSFVAVTPTVSRSPSHEPLFLASPMYAKSPSQSNISPIAGSSRSRYSSDPSEIYAAYAIPPTWRSRRPSTGSTEPPLMSDADASEFSEDFDLDRIHSDSLNASPTSPRFSPEVHIASSPAGDSPRGSFACRVKNPSSWESTNHTAQTPWVSSFEEDIATALLDLSRGVRLKAIEATSSTLLISKMPTTRRVESDSKMQSAPLNNGVMGLTPPVRRATSLNGLGLVLPNIRSSDLPTSECPLREPGEAQQTNPPMLQRVHCPSPHFSPQISSCNSSASPMQLSSSPSTTSTHRTTTITADDQVFASPDEISRLSAPEFAARVDPVDRSNIIQTTVENVERKPRNTIRPLLANLMDGACHVTVPLPTEAPKPEIQEDDIVDLLHDGDIRNYDVQVDSPTVLAEGIGACTRAATDCPGELDGVDNNSESVHSAVNLPVQDLESMKASPSPKPLMALLPCDIAMSPLFSSSPLTASPVSARSRSLSPMVLATSSSTSSTSFLCSPDTSNASAESTPSVPFPCSHVTADTSAGEPDLQTDKPDAEGLHMEGAFARLPTVDSVSDSTCSDAAGISSYPRKPVSGVKRRRMQIVDSSPDPVSEGDSSTTRHASPSDTETQRSNPPPRRRRQKRVRTTIDSDDLASTESTSVTSPDLSTTSDSTTSPSLNGSAEIAQLEAFNSNSRSKRRGSVSPIIDVDSETALKNEMFGILIQLLGTSRVSSMPATDLLRELHVVHPSIKEGRESWKPRHWLKCISGVLQGAELFGRINRSGTDAAGKPLEPQWFYLPEKDPDRDRASLFSVTLHKRRGAAMKHRQYYYRPVNSLSRWDTEDDA